MWSSNSNTTSDFAHAMEMEKIQTWPISRVVRSAFRSLYKMAALHVYSQGTNAFDSANSCFVCCLLLQRHVSAVCFHWLCLIISECIYLYSQNTMKEWLEWKRIHDSIKYAPEELPRYLRIMSWILFQGLVHVTQYGSTLAVAVPGHCQMALMRKPEAQVWDPTDPRVQALRDFKGPRAP